MKTHTLGNGRGWARQASRWALLALAVAAAYFLWTQQWAQLLEALPYLLLAACPLMHLLHRRGHRRHRAGGAGQDGAPADPHTRPGPADQS